MTTCGCTKPLRLRVVDKSFFFADESIGKRMSLTPEGFLLCEAVPIARTGEQIYGPNETPLKVGKDGLVHVQRDAKEVFRPETVASFEGKDVVDEHPEEGVSPDNWRQLTVGHVQNVRRGDGAEDNYLLADLVIKDPDAIAAVRDGKREVSCGYDCGYEQTGDGQGRQYDIVGNHVAIVERGRCGPRCSIKDHSPKEITNMPKKMTVKDRLRKMLGAKDDAEFEQMLAEPDGADAEGSTSEGGVEIHNHIHMPGDTPALAGTGDDPDPDPATNLADPEVDAEELPGWFLEHVAQNNARFDRLEAMIAAQGNGEGAENGDGDDPAVDPVEEMDEGDPELQAEIADADPEAEEDPAAEDDEPEVMDDEGEAMDDEPEPLPKAAKDRRHARDAKGKKGGKGKVTDSALLANAYQDTVAIAEILVPGIRLFTFDAKLAPKKTFDAICKLRRRVLDQAYADEETRPMIDAINGRPLQLRSMSCGAVRVLYRAVGAMKKATNDTALTVVNNGAGGGLGVSGERKIKSPADLNRLNAERYNTAH